MVVAIIIGPFDTIKGVFILKKGDFLWALALGAVCAFLLFPTTHDIFNNLTAAHPYLMGFVKFAILATLGELLAIRISSGDWKIPYGVVPRALIWGFLGMVIVLIFGLFAGGVTSAMAKGMLPGGDSKFLFAFFTSFTMNTTFAPTMMGFHRVTDTYIDIKGEGGKPTLKAITDRIDWNGYVSFVLLKTIPFFWVPAHTITFLLPVEYRVLAAAFLSIALGALLAFGKRKSAA